MIAADSQGRAYVAASNNSADDQVNVVRLNAAGTAVDYTAQVKGTAAAIAVDRSGAAFVAGLSASQNGAKSFLARVAPDGSPGFYSTLPRQFISPGRIAIDANGDAVVFGAGVLQRVNSTGAVTFSTSVQGGLSLALDPAGTAHIAGSTYPHFPVKNSIATCESDATSLGLTALASDGSVLQTTYLPGGQFAPSNLLTATGPNSTVYVVATAGKGYAPTQAGPFPAGGSGSTFLLRLSPNADSPVLPLTCMVNGASLAVGAIAPGEIVTLFGAGLGPQQGVQLQATAQSHYPTQAAGVEVTFDGKLAPLLWVAGFADQCGGTVVADSREEHAGLRLLQQRSYELPDLAGGAVGSGGVHGGWHERGGAESGWNHELSRQSRAARLHRYDLGDGAGSDYAVPG